MERRREGKGERETKELLGQARMKMEDEGRCFYLYIGFFTKSPYFAVPYDGLLYDSSAYTECKSQPEGPLYNGGILKDYVSNPNHTEIGFGSPGTGLNSSEFLLRNLTHHTKYCFSTWIKINGAHSARIKASLSTENKTYNCIGTVVAKSGCWSFLKGGFVLDSASPRSVLFFKNADGEKVNILTASASLQPFTDQQWWKNQEHKINRERKRAVTIHVSDENGNRLQGASIWVKQSSKDFLFGSAIANTILGNLPYQNWFVRRFNAAVFENELKWYATEPERGNINYTIADQMFEFIRANQIAVRGHNIFWEDPRYTPAWVRNLSSEELRLAVELRIQTLMNKYKREFIHWDVSNELLHFDFYEKQLGRNATLHFFKIAHQSDPLATLFINDFNVVETCEDDANSTVDDYISRLRELQKAGASMAGIGLEGHFKVPNIPLMRAVLDKLATLGLPIWLTEIDISNTMDKQTQAIYLEDVLREGFSHPSVTGMMLWTALGSNGCYEMCLTDNEFHNLPAGDVVDKLLQEWQTREREGHTDEHGSYSFYGFLGEYKAYASYGDKSFSTTFSLSRGHETKHFSIQL
ncbi:hypothetical protein NE237_022518 [Protea cynaroides]|uniref:GH10 domain-containing protein n=1 Tax=Protea cynaroides TaxID=273540 RepID=A0A9Q0HB68_9MAGN|nr:hypothetical protein NE237_022518 [Protea cynaroides]